MMTLSFKRSSPVDRPAPPRQRFISLRQCILATFCIAIGSAATAPAQSIRLPDDLPRAQPREQKFVWTQTAAENIRAVASLLGVIRYFHPTSEVRPLDWNGFLARTIQYCESAETPNELTVRLRLVLAPIAPTVQLWCDREAQPPPAANPPEGAGAFLCYRHWGFAQPGSGARGLYRSELIERKIAEFDSAPIPPGTSYTMDLGRGIRARVPIGVYLDTTGLSTPRPLIVVPPLPQRPAQIHSDRLFRMVNLVYAWSTLERFYPYFEVVNTDWNEALDTALRETQTSTDSDQFTDTLRRMIAKLNDGHGGAFSAATSNAFRLPFEVRFVGDNLVITGVDPTAENLIKPGDTVIEIDGRPVADFCRDIAAKTSAATDGFRRACVAEEFPSRRTKDSVPMTIGRPDASRASLTFTPIAHRAARIKRADTPQSGTELAPGIVYFNLVGAKTRDLQRQMNTLLAAKAIVFDCRGYPGQAFSDLLPQFSEERLKSAGWWIPVITQPDRSTWTFNQSNWDLPPKRPRFSAKLVFMTDERAVSYAESCMAIVEAYKLGEIVGDTTAGTNGNVTSLNLPGGYTVQWTGMKVVKHDGSPHHGRGVAPTVPIRPTIAGIAAGRDEVLEKSVEVARSMLNNP